MNKDRLVIARFDEQEKRALAALGGARGKSAVLRELVRSEAQRRGVWPGQHADRQAA